MAARIHLRRRNREVRAVVLPDAYEVEPERVGQYGFRDDVANHLRLGQEPVIRVPGDVAERIETELKWCSHPEFPSV